MQRNDVDGVDVRNQHLEFGRQIIRTEADCLIGLADRIDDSFLQAVDMINRCQRNVITIGMGKAGLIGQKIAATLASTGCCSHFLHPAEAVHGDLGRIHKTDVALVLSNSGETEEILRILPFLAENEIAVIAVTGSPGSSLARQAAIVLDYGGVEEADNNGLAPSTSTTAMLALGDALALVRSQIHGFEASDFAKLHPAGSLGRKMAAVDEFMRPLSQCRIAQSDQTVQQMLVSLGRPGRRSGATLIVDLGGRLTGIFTDSDLARLLENGNDNVLNTRISEVMTKSPRVVDMGTRMVDAIGVFVEQKISEIPVISVERNPVGVLDITDVVAFLPKKLNLSEFDAPAIYPIGQSEDSDLNSPLPRNKKAKSA